MPSSIQNILQTLSHVILTVNLLNTYYYYPHFIDKEPEKWKLRNLPHVMWLMKGGARI